MLPSYDLLRVQPLLAGLNDWQLERLAQHARRSMFHAGHRVFREGEPADTLWLIVHGRVAVDVDTGPEGGAGGRTVVEVLGPGAALGWSWLLPPYRWQFGAVAVETTHTIELDGTAVRALCHRDPILGFQLTLAVLDIVAERLRATREKLADAHAGRRQPRA